MKICPKCGASSDDSMKFCWTCGAALPMADLFDIGAEPAGPVPPAENSPFEYQAPDYGSAAGTSGGDAAQSFGQETGGYQGGGYDANGEPVYGSQQGNFGGSVYQNPNPGPQSGGQAGAGGYGNYYNINVYNTPRGNAAGIQTRSIGLAVFFSIITCGIYMYYWMYKIDQEMNQLRGEVPNPGSGMVVLFSIISCGIYGCYWHYKMGEKIDELKGTPGSSSTLYLILSILKYVVGSWTELINLGMQQDVINKVVEGTL